MQGLARLIGLGPSMILEQAFSLNRPFCGVPGVRRGLSANLMVLLSLQGALQARKPLESIRWFALSFNSFSLWGEIEPRSHSPVDLQPVQEALRRHRLRVPRRWIIGF